ncbi:hypothetical protein F5B22DRAFT_92905 [Xylaria bambusicola]|uniref:uncharacterized protein n=1 Tax=Xylaria bambusicola TaxID=326684 RepID=UPI002008A4EB|nr:uncharacterized protein F5B22DRAFT_92905 [Xylaria bambusicola]KAI0518123.1 hypothetical protein F5B22DRAFT_92905 [Xylaria bambusicola]
MHAVMRSRHVEEPHLYKLKSLRRYIEPFLNARGYRETGHYMDQHFFGGSPFCSPNSIIFDGFSPSIPPPLGIMISKFDLNCKPRVTQPGRICHVPSSWASKLMGEHFWQDPRHPQKSHRSFHRSALTPDSGTEMDLSSLPYVYDEDKVIVASWQKKQDNWKTWRDNWNEKAQRIWTKSPWSSVGSRSNCFKFSTAFSKKDLVTCAAVAYELVGMVGWNEGIDFMQQPPRIPVREWLWHCVGLLMMASIPLLEQELENPYEERRLSEHEPGREARAAGHNDKVITHIPGDRPVFAGPSEFCSMEGTLKCPFTQLDYLDRILDVSTVLQTTRTVVYDSIFMAILQAARDIRANRESMVQSMGASHINSWASEWFFELPAYSSSLIRYNPKDSRWKFVVPN